MSFPERFVPTGTALVSGRAAVVIAGALDRDELIETCRNWDVPDREELLATAEAIHQAAAEWRATAGLSDCGSSVVPLHGRPASSYSMTASTAARELRLSDRRVRQLCGAGQLDAIQDEGGHWRIDPDSVAARKLTIRARRAA